MSRAFVARRLAAVFPIALLALGACRPQDVSTAGLVVAPLEIPLASGRVLPVGDPLDPSLPARLLEASPGRVHLYVRIAAGLDPLAHGALHDGGLVLLDHLLDESYIAAITAPIEVDRPPFAGRVLWVGEILPEDKLHPRLTRGPVAPEDVVQGGAARRVLVTMHPDVSERDGTSALSRLGLRGEPYGDGTLWLVELEPARLSELAAQDEVLAVSPGPEPRRPQNMEVRPSVGTDAVHQFTTTGTSVSYQGLSGLGIRVGIVDDGVDESHPDFGVLPGDVTCDGALPGRFYRIHQGSGDHGTHVASIAVGNGAGSFLLTPLYPWIQAWDVRGHAPRACVGDYNGLLPQIAAYAQAVNVDGTNVFNHSYPLNLGPEYGPLDRVFDRMIRGGTINGVLLPSRPHVFAAGNAGVCSRLVNFSAEQFAGYYSVRVTAKNTIVVGSCDVQGDELSQFSSLGPTFDGRVKPELVAPGTHESHSAAAPCQDSDPAVEWGVLAAIRTTNGIYAYRWGSSMAAPVVTGAIALMMEAVNDAALGLGAGDVRASTWRALLVQSTVDLARTVAPSAHTRVNPDTKEVTTYHPQVDHATGYGKLRTNAACALAADASRWFEAISLGVGDGHEHCVRVPEGSRELTVTLAWDDPPDETITSQKTSRLVNDLDLELVSPTGQIVLPWVAPPVKLGPNAVLTGIDQLDPHLDVVAAGPMKDRLNNLEQVRVPRPAPGDWIARVKPGRVTRGFTQPYSLVATYPFRAICLRRLPICERYPWFCDLIQSRPKFDEELELWTWPVGGVLALEHLRASAGLPPEASLPAWIELPGFEVFARGLPPGAELVLVDGAGELRDVLRTADVRPLRVASRRPGARFQLLLVGSDGRPSAEPAEISLEFRELEDHRNR